MNYYPRLGPPEVVSWLELQILILEVQRSIYRVHNVCISGDWFFSLATKTDFKNILKKDLVSKQCSIQIIANLAFIDGE